MRRRQIVLPRAEGMARRTPHQTHAQVLGCILLPLVTRVRDMDVRIQGSDVAVTHLFVKGYSKRHRLNTTFHAQAVRLLDAPFG